MWKIRKLFDYWMIIVVSDLTTYVWWRSRSRRWCRRLDRRLPPRRSGFRRGSPPPPPSSGAPSSESDKWRYFKTKWSPNATTYTDPNSVFRFKLFVLMRRGTFWGEILERTVSFKNKFVDFLWFHFGIYHILTLIRMTKDEKDLAFFKAYCSKMS